MYNLIFKEKAERLFKLLVNHYQLQEREFSATALRNVAFELGRQEKGISRNQMNKLIQFTKKLSQDKVNLADVQELNDVLSIYEGKLQSIYTKESSSEDNETKQENIESDTENQSYSTLPSTYQNQALINQINHAELREILLTLDGNFVLGKLSLFSDISPKKLKNFLRYNQINLLEDLYKDDNMKLLMLEGDETLTHLNNFIRSLLNNFKLMAEVTYSLIKVNNKILRLSFESIFNEPEFSSWRKLAKRYGVKNISDLNRPLLTKMYADRHITSTTIILITQRLSDEYPKDIGLKNQEENNESNPQQNLKEYRALAEDLMLNKNTKLKINDSSQVTLAKPNINNSNVSPRNKVIASKTGTQSIREEYLTKAKELHQLLIAKFQLPNEPFSKNELSNNGFKLKSKNIVSYDIINKVLNVAKSMSKSKITELDLEEINDLLGLIKRRSNGDSDKTSQLENLFKKLSIQSKDAIINENDFDSFKEYMHIERQIEVKFEEKLFNHSISNPKSILFLIGNVGDGKSHLLSYMNKKYYSEFKEYDIYIHNDATETNSPQSTAIDTLLEVLQPYSDSELDNGETNRSVIAINLGILTNLMAVLEGTQDFSALVNYIKETNVTNNRETLNIPHEIFGLVSFRENSNFEYDGHELTSDFYSQALRRVFEVSDLNPFYVAYKQDIAQGIESILHYNYEFMLRKEFQAALTYLLIRAEIEYKAIISARDLFNLFYDICNPRDSRESYDSYLPYLLFDNASKSDLLTIMSYFDPAKSHTRVIDETAIQLYHATDTYSEVLELLGEERNQFRKVFESFKTNQEDFDDFFNSFLRIKYLLNYKDDLFDNRVFEEYIDQYFNIQQKGNYRTMMLLISRAMERWYGESPKKDHIVRETSNNNVKLILAIKLKPAKPFIQQGVMIFPFLFDNSTYNLEVDYQVFKVLKQVNSGYFLKEEDYQLAVQFDRFIKHYLYSQELLEENYLYNLSTENMYKLSNKYNQIELNKEV